MAKYHGKDACVKKNSVAVIEFNNWSIEAAADVAEGQDFGDTWKSGTAGMMGWSGSMEGNFDPANTEQAAIMNAILTGPTKLTDVVFYIDATKNLSGDIWITGWSANASISDHVKISFSFQGDGTLAYSPT